MPSCVNLVLSRDALVKGGLISENFRYFCRCQVCTFIKLDPISKKNKAFKMLKFLKISVTAESKRTEGKLCPPGPYIRIEGSKGYIALLQWIWLFRKALQPACMHATHPSLASNTLHEDEHRHIIYFFFK